MRPLIPILMYHQVSPRSLPAFRKYTVTPRMFRAQMRWLRLSGYTTISLGTWLAQRHQPAMLPARPVILTFDDGFQDCIDHAVPILKEFGFTATFYLVAGLSGGIGEWLSEERGVQLRIAGWTTVQQLTVEGFTCGSHTMSHPRLAELSVAACRQELVDSRRLLEDRLGHSILDLAYPYGSYNEHVRALAAEAGYRSACSVRRGLSTVEDDPLALHRVPINGDETFLDFMCRLRTAQTFRGALRESASRVWQHVAVDKEGMKL